MITGNKEMGGGVLYDMVYMPYREQDWEPIWNLCPLFPHKLRRPGLRSIKMGWMKRRSPHWNFRVVLANIKTSFGENVNFMNILCEKGEIKIAPYSGYSGVKGSSPLGEINHPYDVPWQQAKQMDDDALAIMQGKPMMVPGEEGLRDIRIVEAIYKSARTKQACKI
jgi:glucose-fructose oxidoreductase